MTYSNTQTTCTLAYTSYEYAEPDFILLYSRARTTYIQTVGAKHTHTKVFLFWNQT